MEISDVNNSSKTLNDVMNRRLKNRERQRRYRERKRLQGNARNGHVTDQSSQMQIVSLPDANGHDRNGNVEQVVTRVHCRRDWKKDARRVHVAIPEAIFNGLLPNGQSLATENNMPHAPLGMRESEQALKSEDSSESYLNRSRPGRRDWKAEARNKK
ncbi:uncharacterized protein LOC110732542 [Chenopodium quinoa]|uniref:uncharacterized protein LOC110732542 n=1 Tax=Chenopodium quinoa TaxID=63459 RepID=UPI000B76E1F4|nr:uncharacterized protein LOC110732542 [Chenopodium quinoa]XP_021768189.1 uncharacterized protein LOC110732542 [Chenopodium quinoa]